MQTKPPFTMRAGVGETDITPPLGLPMWGYAARKEPAQGILDPLYARAIVLEANLNRLAIVSLDLGRTFSLKSLQWLRTTARQELGINCLLLCATHTHSAPVLRDEYPESALPTWEEETLQKIARVLAMAIQNLQEVHIGIGYGAVAIGHNRLRLEPDGKVTWFSSNPHGIPTSPVDPTVAVMRVDSTDRRPLAIIVHHACHPVVFDAINLNYSADFPGVTVRAVRESFESKPICLFLQGASGDINPYFAHLPPLENEMRLRDWTGMRLAQEVVRVAGGISTEPWSTAEIRFVEEAVRLRPRYPIESLRHSLQSLGQEFFEWFAPKLKRTHLVPLTTAILGRQLALMSVPGEPFVEFQMQWRQRCPLPHAWLLGYTNGYLGYFPTIRAAAHGGYGASGPTAWLEVGAGERLINQSLIRVYEMLEMLHPTP